MARKITNKYNLPESLVRAVSIDKHITAGDISVTTLIDAPQIRQLKKNADLEEDVMDMMFAVMGTAVHHVLDLAEVDSADARTLIQASAVLSEQSEKLKDPKLKAAAKFIQDVAKANFPDAFNPNILTETTLSVDVDGMIISGTFDRLIKNELKIQDYKNTGTFNYIYPEARKKWEAQLNVYAYMINRQLGIPVNKGEIIAIFRNWSASSMKQSRDYPKHPVEVIDIKIHPFDKVEAYIKKRVAVHKLADQGQTIECSGEDRWATATKHAVTTPGRKRALILLDSPEAAQNYISKNGHMHPGIYIQNRPGENKRCASFCPVSSICPQYKQILEEMANAEL